MVVTIKHGAGKKTPQKKAKAKADTSGDHDALMNLIDEVGDLEAKIKKLKVNPIHKEYADKKEALLKKLEIGLHAGNTRNEEGRRHGVKLGMRALKRTITNMQGVKDTVGAATFMKLVTFPLGQLDKYCTPEEIEEVIEESRDGSRKIEFYDV